MSKTLAPISSNERLSVIDALRGFAVLGILIMNIKLFSYPPAFEGLFVMKLEGLGELITYWGLEFFFHGKFFTMFTFLFGLGMAVQVSRAVAKNNEKKFPLVYLRRMFFLLVIGLIHDVFIWHGFVLLWYPVMGVLLLFFRKAKPKTLLILALIFILLSIGVFITYFALTRPAPAAPQDTPKASQTPPPSPDTLMERAQKKCDTVIDLYRNGNYWDVVRDLWSKVPMTFLRNLTIGWFVLGMFLLGAWSWRKGLYQDIETHRKPIKKIFLFSLIIGFGFTATYIARKIWGGDAMPAFWEYTGFALLRWLGMIAMCIMYVSGFLLLYTKPFFKRLTRPIESVGRTALSNYIFQNILGGFVFYNYGFRLMGETGPFANLLICLLIFAIQIPLSMWWLRYFRFGPIEWIWRSLTYWKWQPMTIKKTLS